MADHLDVPATCAWVVNPPCVVRLEVWIDLSAAVGPPAHRVPGRRGPGCRPFRVAPRAARSAIRTETPSVRDRTDSARPRAVVGYGLYPGRSSGERSATPLLRVPDDFYTLSWPDIIPFRSLSHSEPRSTRGGLRSNPAFPRVNQDRSPACRARSFVVTNATASRDRIDQPA